MKRRNFLSVIGATLASAIGIKSAESAAVASPTFEPRFANGYFVGSDGREQLWFFPYKKQHGWIGWLDDKDGKCWGFVDDNQTFWQVPHVAANHKHAVCMVKRHDLQFVKTGDGWRIACEKTYSN